MKEYINIQTNIKKMTAALLFASVVEELLLNHVVCEK